MSRRDDRIDFLRGYALIAIFVDHVPHSVFTLASPYSSGFSDAAELFFFFFRLRCSRRLPGGHGEFGLALSDRHPIRSRAVAAQPFPYRLLIFDISRSNSAARR
jgi:hypothetical protein